MLALALEGWALVTQGMVAEEMRKLDESTAAAVAGEIQDIDANVTACCYLISACKSVGDYGRAAQWAQRVVEFASRVSYRSAFSLLPGAVLRRARAPRRLG